MDVAHKIVTRLPLEELWDKRGLIAAKRGRELSEDDIAQLLRTGPVQFVVANAGAPLRWIPMEDRFEFWKRDVKPHLVEPGSRAVLESFPDCYFASEWEVRGGGNTVVVLEKSH